MSKKSEQRHSDWVVAGLWGNFTNISSDDFKTRDGVIIEKPFGFDEFYDDSSSGLVVIIVLAVMLFIVMNMEDEMGSLRKVAFLIAKSGVLLIAFTGVPLGCGGEESRYSDDAEQPACDEMGSGTFEVDNEYADRQEITHVDYKINGSDQEVDFTARDADGNRRGLLRFSLDEETPADMVRHQVSYVSESGEDITLINEVGTVQDPLSPSLGLPLGIYFQSTIKSGGLQLAIMMTGELNETDPHSVSEENPLINIKQTVLTVQRESTEDRAVLVIAEEDEMTEGEVEEWIEQHLNDGWPDEDSLESMVGVLFDEKLLVKFQDIQQICQRERRDGTNEIHDQKSMGLSACQLEQEYDAVARSIVELIPTAFTALIGPLNVLYGIRVAVSGDERGAFKMLFGAKSVIVVGGVKLATGISLVALAKTFLIVAATALTVAAFTYGMARLMGHQCGNPMIQSIAGVAYPFRQHGEYDWYTHRARDTLDIQTRQTPNPASSCADGARIGATAIRAGEDRIAFYADRDKSLWINGEAQDPRDYYWRLGDRTQIERQTVTEGSDEIYFVTSPAGERLRVDVFDDRLDLELDVPEELRSGVRGIIGAPSKEGVEGLELRNGTVLDEPVEKRDLYGEFGTSWQVAPDESLFDYRDGEGPEDYRASGEVPAPRSLEDLSDEQLEYAEYVCRQVGGVTDPTLLRHCLLDVGCTGDSSYMSTYRRIEPPKRSLELVDEAGDPVVDIVDSSHRWPTDRFGFGRSSTSGGEFAGDEFDTLGQASCPADIEKSAESIGGKRIRTVDGLTYDFQAAGEFVLVESKADDPLMVQVRQEPRGGDRCPDARRNTAVAAQMGDHRVVFKHFGAPPVQVDGEEADVPGGFLALGDGHTLTSENAGEYLLQWPDGSWLHVEFKSTQLDIRFNSHYTRLGQLQGIFGQFNGYPDNDIALRNGQVLDDWSSEDIHGEFADSWRISQSESLFDYDDGVTTEDFTDPGVPSEMMTPDDIPDDEEEVARQTCEDSGVSHPDTMATCIIDVYCSDDDDDDDALDAAEALATSEDPSASVDHDGVLTGYEETEDPDDPISVSDGLSAIQVIDGTFGGSHVCTLDDGGELQCWGYNDDVELEPVDSDFAAGIEFVTLAGGQNICGVDHENSLHCWEDVSEDGEPSDLQPYHPPISEEKSYEFVEKNYNSDTGCALDIDGAAHCWAGESNLHDSPNHVLKPPEDLAFSQLTLGFHHICGLKADGSVECWGDDSPEYGITIPPEDGVFVDISAEAAHTCGLSSDGSVHCWGDTEGELIGWTGPGESFADTDSVGPFIAIETGAEVGCGLREDHTLECWGEGTGDNPPSGTFVDFHMGLFASCAIDDGGEVECWHLD